MRYLFKINSVTIELKIEIQSEMTAHTCQKVYLQTTRFKLINKTKRDKNFDNLNDILYKNQIRSFLNFTTLFS